MNGKTTRRGRPNPATEASKGGRPRIAAFGAALLLGTGLAFGCEAPGPAQTLTAEHEAALADTLLAVAEEWNAAWAELDPEPYLAHYGDEARFYYQGAELDRAALGEVVREEMAGIERWSTELVDPRVEVLGPDAGVVSFRYEGEWEDTDGETRDIEAALTLVFERRDGEWTVVQAHESFPPDVEF